jgi:CO/xanthine dehydrogenase FAD-binding subunit
LPALAQTWPDVANIRVRCKGTLGGNIMAADPAHDFKLAALAADARLVFARHLEAPRFDPATALDAVFADTRAAWSAL